MTPEEIEKLFNRPAELSAKTDGKGNEQVTLRGEVADLGWLVNKVVTGIFEQVDDPDAVKALDTAITMTIHLRAVNRIAKIRESDLDVAVKMSATPTPGNGVSGSVFGPFSRR